MNLDWRVRPQEDRWLPRSRRARLVPASVWIINWLSPSKKIFFFFSLVYEVGLILRAHVRFRSRTKDAPLFLFPRSMAPGVFVFVHLAKTLFYSRRRAVTGGGWLG